MFLGMTLMFSGIMLGAPVYISMVLLLAGIGLAYGFGIGEVQYLLTPQGIEQKIRRFIPYAIKRKEETRLINWDKMSSYKIDTDKKRYGDEYEYIKLYLKISPGEIWITDQQDKAGFQQFKDTFLLMLGDFNARNKKTTTETLQPQQATGKSKSSNEGNNPQGESGLNGNYQSPLIRQRQSFYKTFFAKALTIFFTLITILFIWIIAYRGMHFTNWFKLMFIILPGTVYMVYRVFISPGINKSNTARSKE